MSACSSCGLEAPSSYGQPPPGWYSVGFQNGAHCCSADCAATVISNIRNEEAQVWLTSTSSAAIGKSGKG